MNQLIIRTGESTAASPTGRVTVKQRVLGTDSIDTLRRENHTQAQF